MKDYIIFDFDNTLVDSLGYWAKTEFKQLFLMYGKKPDKRFKELKSGTSNAEAAQIFIDLAGVDITVEEVFAKTAELMEHYYTHNVKMILGAKEYLLSLKEQGKKIIIASATQKPLLMIALKHFGLDWANYVYSESTLGLGKNDVRFFESILKDLDVTSDKVLLFEDSLTSIKNARKNNIDCVALIHKFNRKNKKELASYSKLVIKNYKDKKLKSLDI